MSSTPRLVWVMAVVAVVAGAILAGPYLGFDADASRVDVRGGLHWGLLVTHILTAAVALVLGPLQFVPRLRARPRLHRGIGRTYLLAGVLPAGLTGIPVAVMSPSGPVTRIGLLLPAVGRLVTGALAVRAARRRDFSAHRETIPVGQVLGWVVNLVVAERLVRRTPSRADVVRVG